MTVRVSVMKLSLATVFWELVIRDVPRAGRSRDNFG
jgi:hypothetical protein